MSYRNDLDALTNRHAALVAEVEEKQRELDRAGRLLDEAKAKARLPVLDNIRVASPCSADWSKMSGDERARHCGDCNKNVYNLSNMTREEAEALIIAKEGKLCVRYYQRKDGTILLEDCMVGLRRKRRRRLVVAGAAAVLAGGAVFALVDHGDDPRHADVMMGDIEPEHVTMGQVPLPSDPEPPQEIKGGLAYEELEIRMGSK